MKLDRTFEFDELPEKVQTILEVLTSKHVEQLILDYNDTLCEKGIGISIPDRDRLLERLVKASKVTVKIGAKLDDSVLEVCDVTPVSRRQFTFDNFTVHEPEVE